MFHKRRSSIRLLGVSRHFAGLLAVLCLVANPARAADTADESRSINQQVLSLMSASKLADAAALAKKGLALCDDAGSVKVFCAGQFHELLGDIAHRQNQYADALNYHKQALAIRAAGLGHDHLLVARSQFRIGTR
jgi:tetratricopeptide (TPR) repeat protein